MTSYSETAGSSDAKDKESSRPGEQVDHGKTASDASVVKQAPSIEHLNDHNSMSTHNGNEKYNSKDINEIQRPEGSKGFFNQMQKTWSNAKENLSKSWERIKTGNITGGLAIGLKIKSWSSKNKAINVDIGVSASYTKKTSIDNVYKAEEKASAEASLKINIGNKLEWGGKYEIYDKATMFNRERGHEGEWNWVPELTTGDMTIKKDGFETTVGVVKFGYEW